MPQQNRTGDKFDAKAINLPSEIRSSSGPILQKYSRRPSTSPNAVVKRTVRRSRIPDSARRQRRIRSARDVVGATPAVKFATRATRHTIPVQRDAAACHEDRGTKLNTNDAAAHSADDCERKGLGNEEGTKSGERNDSKMMKGEGAHTPGENNLCGETSFLQNETLTSVQSSEIWFVLLCQLASSREPVPLDSFNWVLKCAIGLLHISKEEELSPLRFKSSAIHALSGILQEEEYATKQKRLTHFIQTFKIMMTFFSHLVAYSEGKTPLLGVDTTSNDLADKDGSALQNKLSIEAPCSAIQATDVESIAAKKPLSRGNSAQSAETTVSSTAVALNPTGALLMDSQNVRAGDPESSVFPPASNPRPSIPWSTPSLPFNWMHSGANGVHLPNQQMNYPRQLSELEMHQEGLTDNVMSSSLPSTIQQRLPPYIQPNSGVLPIPETTSGFPKKLAPPKLTDRQSLTAPVLQQTSIFQGRTMAFVRNNSTPGSLPPSNSSALSASDQEALNTVLLLVSGQDQFLVLPSNGFQTRLMHVDEKSTSTETSEKGAAIPFSVAPGLNTDKPCLPLQNAGCYPHPDQIDPPTPFLETCPPDYTCQRTKKRTIADMPFAPQIEGALSKKPLRMSQFQTKARDKNQRLIKCLLTSGGNPRCSLFQISGFVDNDIWTRLPATISISKFDDKTAFELRSKKVKKLALRLDEEVPCCQAVPQLYEQNLVAIATLPGLSLIVVPIHTEPHVFDIDVFVASTTRSAAEVPCSSST